MSTEEQRAKKAERMRKYRAEHPEYVAKGREAIAAKREVDPEYARTPNEERKRQRTEYMRKWRAEHPGRQPEIDRAFLERWREEHPEVKVGYHAWWRKAKNPESVKRSQRKRVEHLKEARAADPEPFRARDNARIRAVSGIPERTMQEAFAADHPTAVSMDRIRPDFYIPGDGFVEIKRALPYQAYIWRQQSPNFPGLFFMNYSGKVLRANGQLRRDLETQIALCPRPLTVIVYHALTGEELARQTFH